MKGEWSKWADWLNLIAGAWFFSVPLWQLEEMTAGAASSHYLSGLALIIVSIISLARPRLWEEWVNLLIGLWIFIAPFTLGIWESQWSMWNHLIVGAFVTALSLFALISRQRMQSASY